MIEGGVVCDGWMKKMNCPPGSEEHQVQYYLTRGRNRDEYDVGLHKRMKGEKTHSNSKKSSKYLTYE